MDLAVGTKAAPNLRKGEGKNHRRYPAERATGETSQTLEDTTNETAQRLQMGDGRRRPPPTWGTRPYTTTRGGRGRRVGDHHGTSLTPSPGIMTPSPGITAAPLETTTGPHQNGMETTMTAPLKTSTGPHMGGSEMVGRVGTRRTVPDHGPL